MATGADDFDLVCDSFAVGAAVLFLFGWNADTGGIGAFPGGDGGHGISPSWVSVFGEPSELTRYDAFAGSKDGEVALKPGDAERSRDLRVRKIAPMVRGNGQPQATAPNQFTCRGITENV